MQILLFMPVSHGKLLIIWKASGVDSPAMHLICNCVVVKEKTQVICLYPTFYFLFLHSTFFSCLLNKAVCCLLILGEILTRFYLASWTLANFCFYSEKGKMVLHCLIYS